MTLKESNVNNPMQVSEANAAWGYKNKKNDFGGKFAFLQIL